MKQPEIFNAKDFNLLKKAFWMRKGTIIYLPEDSELCNKGFIELTQLIYSMKEDNDFNNPHRLLIELTALSDGVNNIKDA